MGKAKAQQRLIDNLEDEFAKVLFNTIISTRISPMMFAHIKLSKTSSEGVASTSR